MIFFLNLNSFLLCKGFKYFSAKHLFQPTGPLVSHHSTFSAVFLVVNDIVKSLDKVVLLCVLIFPWPLIW